MPRLRVCIPTSSLKTRIPMAANKEMRATRCLIRSGWVASMDVGLPKLTSRGAGMAFSSWPQSVNVGDKVVLEVAQAPMKGRPFQNWRTAGMLAAVCALGLWHSGAQAQGQQQQQQQQTAPTKTPAEGKDSAAAAAKGSAPAQVPEFTSSVNLVLVPVVITDPLNRMVTGLEKQFFTLSEDNVQQTIKTFSTEDAPISVGVVFDSSGSMSDKIDESRRALIQFFRTANPQDEFFLVDFADQPRMLCNFTSNIDQIEDSVTFLQPQGRTALLDAIYLSLAEMRHAKYQRRALLIISDGGDNHSRYSERDIERVVREANVQIYGIGLYSATPATQEEINGPALLDKITESTGGKTFEIHDVDEL